MKKSIAIVGGGPAALFLYKRMIDGKPKNTSIDIFECKNSLGRGMPYSGDGANNEHITNVSGNEIPELVCSVTEWVKSLPGEELAKYHLNRDSFHEFMVLPRLLFGEYLNSQFKLLFEQAKKLEIITTVHLNSKVVDINDLPSSNCVKIKTAGGNTFEFSHVVISTGHTWQATHEGRIPGYFDSPYPPSKLKLAIDHPIAIRGSSLTAIDAIRTLARNNGKFVEEESHKLSYQLNKHAENFKMVMHFRQGLLPGVRFHLED